MDIQQLHMQNNFYREMIQKCKDEINTWDKKIAINERLMGVQLEDMQLLHKSHDDTIIGCTLCMGDCNA